MTKEELEKATGMELIEQRNFCGVDGYYGDYILDVNAEMLKIFNRLNELEKENAELKESVDFWEERYWILNDVYVKVTEEKDNKLIKAKELLSKLSQLKHRADDPFTCDEYLKLISGTETFLKELE